MLKNGWKKTLAYICVLALCLQLTGNMVWANDTAISEPDGSDPFAMMYDANELLAKALEQMPESDYHTSEGEEADVGQAEAEDAMRRSGSLAGPAFVGEDEAAAAKERAIEQALDGDFSEIEDLALPDEVQIMIEQLYENLLVDRFIVKYREGADRTAPRNGRTATQAIAYDAAQMGDTELLLLDGKVNPRAFADELRASGLAEEIEYIQPDFRLYYAAGSLGLTVNAVMEGEADETPSNETPNETDDGEPSEEFEQEPKEAEVEVEAEDEAEVEAEVGAEAEAESPMPVIVAVIDTGIDISHDAFDGKLVPGWDFAENQQSVYHPAQPLQSAHGTHVAGIIAETAGENVRIMPLQVFGDNGAYTSDILAAIAYAEENGARIANMSLGSTDYNRALYEAMEDSSLLFVAAAGNARADLSEAPVYPACFDLPNLITVTSVNADGGLSYFSNYNSELVDIAALGREVYSALPGNEWGLQTGTSMAAAEVSGVAAAFGFDAALDAAAAKTRLLETADILLNLQGRVADGRRVSLDNLLAGVTPNEAVDASPADDFDKWGSGQVAQSEEYGGLTENTAPILFEVEQEEDRITQISSRGYHNLALFGDGTVWTWGNNASGQLGDGSTTNKTTPIQMSGLSGVAAVAAGGSHSLCLKKDGTVWAWGSNAYGQLGDGSTVNKSTPTQVSGLSNIAAVAAGSSHTLIVKADGTVWAWGSNANGLLGDGTTVDKKTPVKVLVVTGAVAVSAGNNHSLALKSDGTVWAWGSNSYGQLGDGTTVSKSTPVQVSGLSGIVSVMAASNFSLALKSDGTVWAWGYNIVGQLGDGTTANKSIPVQVIGLTGVTVATAGSNHGLALKGDGTVWIWGSGFEGQFGNGTTTMAQSTPSQAVGFFGATTLMGGGYHSLALKSDNTLWASGDNKYGQLGDGTTTKSTIPVRVQLASAISSHALQLSLSQNQTYIISAEAQDVPTFSGKTFTVTYDQTKLQLLDFAAQTAQNTTTSGAVVNTALTIVSHANGVLTFTVNKEVASGQGWSGILTVMKFKALASGETTISFK